MYRGPAPRARERSGSTTLNGARSGARFCALSIPMPSVGSRENGRESPPCAGSNLRAARAEHRGDGCCSSSSASAKGKDQRPRAARIWVSSRERARAPRRPIRRFALARGNSPLTSRQREPLLSYSSFPFPRSPPAFFSRQSRSRAGWPRP